MMTKMIRPIVCLTLFLTAAPTSLAGTIALSGFTAGSPQVDTTGKTWGWQFKPTKSIEIDSLGAFEYTANGSRWRSDHEVGIWSNSGGQPLVSATVTSTSPTDGSGYPNGVFRYAKVVRPVTLTANEIYVVGMTVGADAFYAINQNVTLDPVFDRATSATERVSTITSPNLVFPFASNSRLGYFGPNFTFTVLPGVAPVPEPTGLAIFGIGALGTLTIRRRRTPGRHTA
jgi:hypothetical protein